MYAKSNKWERQTTGDLRTCRQPTGYSSEKTSVGQRRILARTKKGGRKAVILAPSVSLWGNSASRWCSHSQGGDTLCTTAVRNTSGHARRERPCSAFGSAAGGVVPGERDRPRCSTCGSVFTTHIWVLRDGTQRDGGNHSSCPEIQKHTSGEQSVFMNDSLNLL